MPGLRWPRRLPSGAPLTLALIAALLAVNALAIAGIVTARRSAREAAQQDLRLQTEVHARALEAVLGDLRRDFQFLTRSPSLTRLMARHQELTQGATRGAAQREAEETLLLFLSAHPEVHALALRDPQGGPLVLAARRGGRPSLLPAASDPPAPIADRTRFVAQFPVPGAYRQRGLLEAWIEPAPLLESAAPTLGGHLDLRQADVSAATAGEGELVAHAAVRDPLWSPPIAWTLVRGERESRILGSINTLVQRYRRTALLNLGVVSLTLLVGGLALRQMRRAAALEAESRHQARLRELERQALHSERLASVGRLAAGVAHEINNPLEGVSNYLSLLEEDLRAGDVAGAGRLVGRVKEGLGRVAAVVRQMLTFSDPGRGARQPLDLRRPVESAVEFVRANREFRDVAIDLDLAPEPVPVRGNATTLGQLALNLLLNACQAQDGRGRVRVVCRRRGERAQLSVADQGPGLSPEMRRHLFEPFFSTRGSTGLGLAMCHGIVRDHEGVIDGGNTPEGGALFTVELPLLVTGREGAAVAEPAVAAAAEGTRR